MLTEALEEQAALYAAGALRERERLQFELVLEFHTELREFTQTLQELTSATTLATQREDLRPSADLKQRLLRRIAAQPQQTREAGFVMAGPDALVQWVNPAFTAMCGYAVEELVGKKLGPILQGELTDRAAAARVREAVQKQVPCSEALINYHKNGTPYWVSVNITPLHDADGQLLWYVARELELPERQICE